MGLENATNLLVNGSAITGSKWTGTTKIYYNGGNVGIGTTDPQTELHMGKAHSQLIISQQPKILFVIY